MNKSKNKNILGAVNYKAKKMLPIVAAVIVGMSVNTPVFASEAIPSKNNAVYSITVNEAVTERGFRHGRTTDSNRTVRESNRRTESLHRTENGEGRESRQWSHRSSESHEANEVVTERRFRHRETTDSDRTFRESNRRTESSRRAERHENRENHQWSHRSSESHEHRHAHGRG